MQQIQAQDLLLVNLCNIKRRVCGAAYDNSGWSVSSAGDVNNDGYDDLIVGAPYAAPSSRSYAGQSY